MYELEIREAMSGTILKNISQEDLIVTISKLISELYLVLGFKLPDPNTFSTILLHMVKTLQICYKSFTIEEVKLCFDMGTRGNLGSFVGLNVYTLSTWLSAYRNSDVRLKVINRIWEEEEEAKRKAQREEAAKHFNFEEYVQQCYESYLEYGTERILIAPFTFDRLQKMNMIHVADDKFQATIEKQVERMKNQKMNQARGRFLKISEIDLQDWFYTAEMRAKENFVVEYFNRLKSLGMTKVPFVTEKLEQ